MADSDLRMPNGHAKPCLDWQGLQGSPTFSESTQPCVTGCCSRPSSLPMSHGHFPR
jgi:hypothetical protein